MLGWRNERKKGRATIGTFVRTKGGPGNAHDKRGRVGRAGIGMKEGVKALVRKEIIVCEAAALPWMVYKR